MTNAIHLDRNQVPAAIRGGYTGKKFQVVVTESVTIPAEAGLWFHGSRDLYKVVELFSGRRQEAPNQHLDPWTSARQARKVELRDGYAVVEHSIFQGKDMGLTIYINPVNATAFLPAKVELTEDQFFVLDATKRLVSSYNGRDRFQLANEELVYARKPAVSRERWDAAKAELISAGLLTKSGAITTKGKNAIQ